MSKEKICPRCGKKYTGYPSTSRRDNKTHICSECGTKAMFDYWLSKQPDKSKCQEKIKEEKKWLIIKEGKKFFNKAGKILEEKRKNRTKELNEFHKTFVNFSSITNDFDNFFLIKAGKYCDTMNDIIKIKKECLEFIEKIEDSLKILKNKFNLLK